MKPLSWILACLLVLGLLPQAMAAHAMAEETPMVHNATGGDEDHHAGSMDLTCDHGCKHCMVCAAVAVHPASLSLPSPRTRPFRPLQVFTDQPQPIDTPPPQHRA